jgi:hypothetical protein
MEKRYVVQSWFLLEILKKPCPGNKFHEKAVPEGCIPKPGILSTPYRFGSGVNLTLRGMQPGGGLKRQKVCADGKGPSGLINNREER